MPKIKMRETRPVAPDGVHVVTWKKDETYEVSDPDLLDVLLRENAAERVGENKKESTPDKKPNVESEVKGFLRRLGR